MPAHVVSPGYVILSTFTKPRLDAWIAAHDFGKFTAHTTTEITRFRDAVSAARQLGYWAVDQHLDVGLAGSAVVLRDRKGRCLGALSVIFQAQAYANESFLVKLLPALQEAAQAIRAVV